MKRTIKSLSALLKAVGAASERLECRTMWWRGHSRSKWELVPGLLRRKDASTFESPASMLFQQGAGIRCSDIPDKDDYAGWMFLMQHHRLPTRLLDWSESPLTAAYFAVSDDPGQEGTIWGLSPFGLNHAQIGVGGIPHPLDAKVRSLFERPFKVQKKTSDIISAVLTQHIDMRMMLQLSAFTIHGTDVPIEQLEGSDAFLVRFTVPSEFKQGLRGALRAAGIRSSALFPELEYLAADIRLRSFKSE